MRIVSVCAPHFAHCPADTSLLRIKRAYPTVTAISGYAYSDNVTTANTGTLFTAIESFKADNLARLRELRRGRKRNTSGAAGRPRAAARPWPVQRAPASVGKRWAVLFPGADHAVQQMSQDARGDEARVDVSLFFGVDSLLVVVLLVWIGFVITLASKVAFIERAVRAYPTVATLGAFGPEPSREQLLKQTATWKFVATDGAALRVDAQFKMADPVRDLWWMHNTDSSGASSGLRWHQHAGNCVRPGAVRQDTQGHPAGCAHAVGCV